MRLAPFPSLLVPPALFLATAIAVDSGVAAPRMSPLVRPVVAIQPLGSLSPGLLDAVARRIEQVFAVTVFVLPAEPPPRCAFYPARKRFRGERILSWLEMGRPPRATKVLGFMSADLSVTKGEVYDWGVMGVAGLSRSAGVVSIHRLGDVHASPRRVARRASQVALHELGHTFGLPHCRSPHCIMNDAEGGIGSVDASSGSFCSRCRGRLQAADSRGWCAIR